MSNIIDAISCRFPVIMQRNIIKIIIMNTKNEMGLSLVVETIFSTTLFSLSILLLNCFYCIL